MNFSPDRVKHLEFIQATIARQASHSFTVKGWSLTVAAVVYAYTASHLSWWLAIMALVPPAAFAWLDLYYLRQERLFRELYEDAIKPHTTVPPFDMKPTRYHDTKKHPRCSYKCVAGSPSWWPLHLVVVGVGVVLLGVAMFK